MSKRMFERVTITQRVAYRNAQGRGEGTLLDLSPRGCRIQGVAPGSCGTRLRVKLWLADPSRSVEIELAAIRWVKPDEFGVLFLDVPPYVQRRLAQVFQSLPEATVIP